MIAQIQIRRGTTAEWAASTVVLASGEPGFNTTLERMKIGNGTDLWDVLPWATNADLESTLATHTVQIEVLDSEVSALASGSPAGTYANLAALDAADPDHAKIYITLDDGKWCYHNGSAFVAGGVYQATSPALDSINPKHTTFFDKPASPNLFDNATITAGHYVGHGSGVLIANADYYTSDYIAVDAETAYWFNHIGFYAEYDSGKTFISGGIKGDGIQTLTTSATTAFIRFSGHYTFKQPYDVVAAEGAVPTVTEYKINEDYLPGALITVDVNGTGDYTKLIDGIAAAYAIQNTTVRVLAGTYDIVSELGTLTGNGPVVGNGMHLIFSPGAFVTCHYTGEDDNVQDAFAPINAGTGDFIIEGMNISASRTRYCVHDELAGALGFRRHEYRNCTMYFDNRLGLSTVDGIKYTACIGAGLGAECQIIIDGGYYYSETPGHPVTRWGRTISYHNGNNANALSEIIVKNVYFDGEDAGLSFGSYGPSTKLTKCYVSNCSYLSAPSLTPDTPVNMEIIAFNNEIRTP
jgi:hypothetical protein